ncbi:MAG: hypothetical protein K2H29_09975 [Oscillospiraceae bacterium]|nr:hypothetical protein [Oscillospiraceae bacterium]
MKKYGQAEYIWHLIALFINNEISAITSEQRELLRKKCFEEIFQNYPSVRDWEADL